MQRRHSSNTDSLPPERSRSQTLSSETSVDEGTVFDVLKSDVPSPQQIFSSLAGLQPGAITIIPFQSSLVLGSSASGGEVFIQMSAPREDGAHRSEGGTYHHHHNHRQQPQQQPQHFHHNHHRSSLLHVASEHHSHTEESSEEPGTPAPALSELRAVISWLQKGLPFILILLAKVCFQHKLGETVCAGCPLDFAVPDWEHTVFVLHLQFPTAVQQVLICLLEFIVLIFLKPKLKSLDFFQLMWIVGIADFVLKYITVALKCLILALPRIVLAVKSKGKFYLLIEELSQLFRTLVPIQLWYKYIVGNDPSSSYFLGGILIILYSLCKSFDICGRIGGVRKALKILCSSQSYAIRATSQQCAEAGDICAICQAEFKEPLSLMCQHVFCEECLCLWFDRERTCPLCRAVAVESLCLWRDGTTSAHFQIY
uniref:RING finger and transmembrane domain-containing protein 2-like isoform X1 n=1 Tax=Geotrypetes seraphini TaxID=260995 RepID=A0A6P8RWH9_GEOSA|nr:RING finger and transmembrane domain-containing protein 2-like isoform X1 [Geotrypetes seraphini]XP_033810098.1 RING finger and transmembrane domain-containing protein 2-like isoform X1 [Geotrypetes seraphini]XP_033810100.1 RING finger and transmembrane domain-containing protein 2-like isoform X1 [Geotrypetes seraphini]